MIYFKKKRIQKVISNRTMRKAKEENRLETVWRLSV